MQKNVGPYEHIYDWEKLNKISIPENRNFNSQLNLEDYTDITHAKRVCKDFEIKNTGEYHDLYVQRNTSLLVDVSNNLQNMCPEIHGFGPSHFFLHLD